MAVAALGPGFGKYLRALELEKPRFLASVVNGRVRRLSAKKKHLHRVDRHPTRELANSHRVLEGKIKVAESEGDDLVNLFAGINLDPKIYKSFPHTARRSNPQDAEEGGDGPPVNFRHDTPSFTVIDQVPSSEKETWNALDSMWERSGVDPATNARPNGASSHRNVALTSVCSGVGATSIAASLARLSSQAGEPTHIVTCSGDGLLPLYFGVTGIGSAELVMIPNSDRDSGTIEIYSPGEKRTAEDIKTWVGEIFERNRRRSVRIIFDLGPLRPAYVSAILPDVRHLLILVPDIRCLSVLERWQTEQARKTEVPNSTKFSLVLNQFSSQNPLHQEIQKKLNSQFPQCVGPRPIRRDRNLGIALAHGATVLDYAPNSGIAEDLIALDEWLHSQASASSVQMLRASQGG